MYIGCDRKIEKSHGAMEYLRSDFKSRSICPFVSFLYFAFFMGTSEKY